MAVARKGTGAGEPARAGGNVLGLLLTLALTLGALFYIFNAATSGDWLWFSTSFDARPIQLTVTDRGQHTQLGPDEPRFEPLVQALNESIEQGYFSSSISYSQPTWELIGREALMVEATYLQPAELHGGYGESKRLLLVVSGEGIHTTQLMYWMDDANPSMIPVKLKSVAPLEQALARQGFGK
ncbi:MAG TPA: hypothetical protein VFS21_07650 [Roseiflexaceae bacterium]|nr:hypothetical protein [Roseiflexaceae bacterium]